jgi:O-methyltransferase involved in polyketide biosynthesis
MAVDITKPSVGRMYDYVLGGHHNFEVDRAAAQRIMQVAPSYPTWARLNRWFLQMVAAQWAREGQSYVLDLGSGLPTQDHFHTAMPSARVLYTDHDSVTAAYAREVLGDDPEVSYLHADVRDLPTILAEAEQLFDGGRRIAIGCIGISYFLDDASVQQIMQGLHDWAAPGSVMALSFGHADPNDPHAQDILEMYKRLAADLFMRDQERMQKLCAPWRFRECRPLAAWLGVESILSETDREGGNVEMYGVLLDYEG